MATKTSSVPENIECPLCLGKGELQRAELLERLGMKDYARVAQLSAEEAFRLLIKKHKQEEDAAWVRFESELNTRVNDLNQRHKKELLAVEREKDSVEARLQALEKTQAATVKNAKDAERLETEKQLRTQMTTLESKLASLQAEMKLAEQTKKAEVDKVRNDLTAIVNAEKSKTADLSRKVTDYLGEITTLREDKEPRSRDGEDSAEGQA